MGAITHAMARAVEHYGGTIKTGAAVETIPVRDGKAIGVKLSTGEEITAQVVLSNADLQQTFLKMVGTDYLDANFAEAVKNIRCESTHTEIGLALSELPDFRLPEERLSSLLFVCPSWQYAERAWYDYTVHEITEKPLLALFVAPHFDETMCPAGTYVINVSPWPMPYDLAKGNWDDRKEELMDRAVDVLAEYAPNIKSSIIARDAWTPLDLERNISMPRGDWAHGLMTWDQMLAFRPLIGYTDYRTPIADLYLCGSGVHPGGAVMAAPGHNAAQIVLADWKEGAVK
jgi:phytoene dehydrogenase-like protein